MLIGEGGRDKLVLYNTDLQFPSTATLLAETESWSHTASGIDWEP